jgi:peptidoglycan glycosyltransferase
MITRDLPDIGTLPGLLNPPDGLLLQPTRFYDRAGEHILLSLEHPAASQKQYLSFEQIPTSLISATIAALEPGFWQSPGFSLTGMNSGARPTIAQRLVSDLVFWDEPEGIRRAVRERVYAAQITARFGREQVLTWYLNSASFGRLAFGADAASRAYFGKPAERLNLSESALLAAIAQAAGLDPQKALEIAQENREKVLDSMADQGLITHDQAKAASRQEPNLQDPAGDQDLSLPGFSYW